MSVKNKFPDPVADVKLVPKVAYFAPEGVAYFSPEWVAYFAPERWHTIVRIIHLISEEKIAGTQHCQHVDLQVA